PTIFITLLLLYKFTIGTRIRSLNDMRNAWFVRDATEKEGVGDGDGEEQEESGTTGLETGANGRKRKGARGRVIEFLSWVR
ncbi:MAG: hypothetical protein Q9169_008121, partial [Polycauliona sp. 2 TL-2023]